MSSVVGFFRHFLTLVFPDLYNTVYSNAGSGTVKEYSLIREGCKIKNRLNLGHCPNRREGGPKDCPNVPTLILNLIFNIINSNVVQHNSNVVQHTSNVVTLIEDESSKPSSSPPPSFCLV